MNAHTFTSAAGSKGKCDECGKTRNAKAHKLVAEVEATTVAEARAEMLPEVDAQVDDAEIADALEAAGVQVEDEVIKQLDELIAEEVDAELSKGDVEPSREAEVAKAKKDAVALWVGWRIAESVTGDSTLAAKLQAAKPTADRDRTVRLTVAELNELDTVAERFQKEGKTGPEIYSGRALRGRIAAAIAKIEESNK